MADKTLTRSRVFGTAAISALIMLVVAIVTPLIGSSHVDYASAFAGVSPHKEILFYARLPRVLLALLAGGALALAGVLFQALLRDSLATPDTLGVSSGASLGAVVAICLGWGAGSHMPPIWVAALIGAATTLFLVMAIGSEGRRMSSFTLLLTGVSINTICMATILFLQNIADFTQSFGIVRWLMGGIEPIEYSTLAYLAVVVISVSIFLFRSARDWNLLAVGEEWAASRGVHTSRLLYSGYIAGSILAGVITSLTGPILFVGLIVPHALRLRLGADHRILMPCSFFLGGAFLAICDTVARTILAPTEVPVGVITAMLGGPFFIWLLRSKRRSLWM